MGSVKHRPHWCPCGQPKCNAWTDEEVRTMYLKLMLRLRAFGNEQGADYLLMSRERMLDRQPLGTKTPNE